MAKYHVVPETGVPAVCRARFRRCKYEDFDSRAEALAAIEESALREMGSTVPEAQSREPRESPPLGELRVAKEKKHSDSHYQELWLRDEKDSPAVYVKVNLMSWGRLEDGSLGKKPGVVVCDVEINPKLRGQGYALSTIRRLKEVYGVETVEFTGTFSQSGYGMFQKMKAEEDRTGERLVSIQHGERLIVPREGQEYSFVSDWDTEESKYPL